jgi:hypothetical protein
MKLHVRWHSSLKNRRVFKQPKCTNFARMCVNTLCFGKEIFIGLFDFYRLHQLGSVKRWHDYDQSHKFVEGKRGGYWRYHYSTSYLQTPGKSIKTTNMTVGFPLEIRARQPRGPICSTTSTLEQSQHRTKIK